MKLFKALSLIPIAFGSLHSVSANEYKFEDIKLSVANPLLIVKNKTYLNKNQSKERLYYSLEFQLLFIIK